FRGFRNSIQSTEGHRNLQMTLILDRIEQESRKVEVFKSAPSKIPAASKVKHWRHTLCRGCGGNSTVRVVVVVVVAASVGGVVVRCQFRRRPTLRKSPARTPRYTLSGSIPT